MPKVVSFEDILQNSGVASVLIKLLQLDDKRNLRVVSHAGKDAVDKTVTVADNQHCIEVVDYASILVNSNWQGLRTIKYSDHHSNSKGSGIGQIAEGGFSKLECLFIGSVLIDTTSAQKVINACWKLKALELDGDLLDPKWFDAVMRFANWPLEFLDLYSCTDEMAETIGKSDWKLKVLRLNSSKISSEGFACLMQGSWVSTIEDLDLYETKIDAKGARAIAEASHRAVKLNELDISDCSITNQEALILGEGSYPSLKRLELSHNTISVSGLVSILKKCPVLATTPSFTSVLTDAIDDPEDAKIIAENMRGVLILDSNNLPMTAKGIHAFFTYCNLPKLERLSIHDPAWQDCCDEIITAVIQGDWPCLKDLSITDLRVSFEGNKLLSAKQWPALELLVLEVFHPGLQLESKNLPRLMKLSLKGNFEESMSYVAQQIWPHINQLWFPGNVNNNHDNAALNKLKMIQGINHKHMPSLRFYT